MADPVIVFVHGLGLRQPEQAEFALWRQALLDSVGAATSMEHVPMSMAYYNDELHPEVERRRRRSGPLRATDVDSVIAEAAAARLVGLTLGQNTDGAPAGATAATPARVRRRGTDPVTGLPQVSLRPGDPYPTFCRDIVKYLGMESVRPKVNAKLIDQLDRVAGHPLLVVAHSLGSVVAFDVLATLGQPVDTLITIGSPLGWGPKLQESLRPAIEDLDADQVIKLAKVVGAVDQATTWIGDRLADLKSRLGLDRRRRADRRGAVIFLPETAYLLSVGRWYNVYDPADPVAQPPVIGQPRLAPLYRDSGHERVYDIVITNPGSDAHSEVGYLATRPLAGLVTDFLERTRR